MSTFSPAGADEARQFGYTDNEINEDSSEMGEEDEWNKGLRNWRPKKRSS
jgi:hypothetical protein